MSAFLTKFTTNSLRPLLCRFKYTEKVILEKNIEDTLRKKFGAQSVIKVKDLSGGCGAIYEVYVESRMFDGLPMVKQHQVVTSTLSNEIKHLHGIRVITHVPQNIQNKPIMTATATAKKKGSETPTAPSPPTKK